MKAKLVTELYQDGLLLESRERWSRSFTKNFLGLLYLAHAQINSASPYTMTDVLGESRGVDCQTYGRDVHYTKGNLRIAAPSGLSKVLCPTGIGVRPDYTSYPVHLPIHFLLGEHVGIQVGSGSDAPLPADNALRTKIFSGKRAAIAVAGTIESCKEGDNYDRELYTENWAGQTFIPYRGFSCSGVKLKLWREGSPDCDMTISIRGTDMEGAPAGSDLASVTVNSDSAVPYTEAPGDWVEFNFPSPVTLYPGFQYAIVVRLAGGSRYASVHWRYASSGAYAKGCSASSSDSGVRWYLSSGTAQMFDILGTAGPEVEYGGCELFDFTIADPNGEFSIRRLFTNKSGGTIIVNEVGIYATGTIYSTSRPYGQALSFCTARDVISPGISVAGGQVLAVIYVPQITV